ncbi:hypothetical protein RR46_07791 [Papilio xuthus]|uniref:Uncharacterized protein n=1 Tax=Papilio xuthus TaxID=66420 RepID=A0A194QEX8_PAPXU|nr:hypothetical protein RR46_07791 [Papilio xuthus]
MYYYADATLSSLCAYALRARGPLASSTMLYQSVSGIAVQVSEGTYTLDRLLDKKWTRVATPQDGRVRRAGCDPNIAIASTLCCVEYKYWE